MKLYLVLAASFAAFTAMPASAAAPASVQTAMVQFAGYQASELRSLTPEQQAEHKARKAAHMADCKDCNKDCKKDCCADCTDCTKKQEDECNSCADKDK